MAYILECMEKYNIIVFVQILIKVVIGTLKRCGILFNKLFIKSNPLSAFKSYCRKKNYEINSFYKIYQTLFLLNFEKLTSIAEFLVINIKHLLVLP